jgi:hypothetical protein
MFKIEWAFLGLATSFIRQFDSFNFLIFKRIYYMECPRGLKGIVEGFLIGKDL